MCIANLILTHYRIWRQCCTLTLRADLAGGWLSFLKCSSKFKAFSMNMLIFFKKQQKWFEWLNKNRSYLVEKLNTVYLNNILLTNIDTNAIDETLASLEFLLTPYKTWKTFNNYQTEREGLIVIFPKHKVEGGGTSLVNMISCQAQMQEYSNWLKNLYRT